MYSLQVNLTWLDLSFNSITKLEGLSRLKKVTDLSLFSNKLERIENIETLEDLVVLSLGEQSIPHSTSGHVLSCRHPCDIHTHMSRHTSTCVVTFCYMCHHSCRCTQSCSSLLFGIYTDVHSPGSQGHAYLLLLQSICWPVTFAKHLLACDICKAHAGL